MHILRVRQYECHNNIRRKSNIYQKKLCQPDAAARPMPSRQYTPATVCQNRFIKGGTLLYVLYPPQPVLPQTQVRARSHPFLELLHHYGSTCSSPHTVPSTSICSSSAAVEYAGLAADSFGCLHIYCCCASPAIIIITQSLPASCKHLYSYFATAGYCTSSSSTVLVYICATTIIIHDHIAARSSIIRVFIEDP